MALGYGTLQQSSSDRLLMKHVAVYSYELRKKCLKQAGHVRVCVERDCKIL